MLGKNLSIRRGGLMLGYTTRDIIDMQTAIIAAQQQLSPNLLTTDDIKKELSKAFNLLQGLMAEGHIQ